MTGTAAARRTPLHAASLALLERLPFADAASPGLPLPRLVRLGLFQVSCGMAQALMVGALNRVMIVELAVPATVVALVVAMPMLASPLRALFGFQSDMHRSAFGWRRVPFIWRGTALQFFGFSLMPFALLTVTGLGVIRMVQAGWVVTAIAFLMVGIGVHMTQTAGLALASDLADDEVRPRVVALLWLLLLVGLLVGALVFGAALREYSPTRLVQVVQGAGLLTLALNVTALWAQEPRDRRRAEHPAPAMPFAQAWAEYRADPRAMRLLLLVGIGALAFNMQDVLLEPYGGQVLGLSVSQTTLLTAIMAVGSLTAFATAARLLQRGTDAIRLAGFGMVAGLFAFALVMLSQPLGSPLVFRLGALLIGFGGGLFSVGTLSSAMARASEDRNGLALGAWGAVQAGGAGLAMAIGGALRDAVQRLAEAGALGPAIHGTGAGYLAVYQLELMLLFVALAVAGPLAAPRQLRRSVVHEPFGLADLPG